MSQPSHQAAELLRTATYWVALTGAGISTHSGIPDFRSERSGLWNFADPFEMASLWGFHDHPAALLPLVCTDVPEGSERPAQRRTSCFG